MLSKSQVGPDNRMKLTSPKTFPNQLNPICWAQTFLWPRITHTGKRSYFPPINRVNRVWSNFKMGCKYFPRENFYSILGYISPPGFHVIRPLCPQYSNFGQLSAPSERLRFFWGLNYGNLTNWAAGMSDRKVGEFYLNFRRNHRWAWYYFYGVVLLALNEFCGKLWWYFFLRFCQKS